MNFSHVDNNKKLSCRREATQYASCLSVVSFNSTYLQRSFLLLVTAASDLLLHKINFENIFIHKHDGRTDGQTPHDDIGRAYASHRTAKLEL